MLLQLLHALQSGGTLDARSLAARLNTTPEMVEALLEHLQRSGLVRPYFNCGDGCQGCSLHSDCSIKDKNSTRLWTVG